MWGGYHDAAGVVSSPKFIKALGAFYMVWQTAELLCDYAIAEFLDIPYEEKHLLTAGQNLDENFVP